jgi:hypothetical protein
MAPPELSGTPPSAPAAARVPRAARGLGPPRALALLLCGVLGMPAIAAAQAPASLSGTWQLSCSGHRGRVRQITLKIDQSGSKLSGSFSGPLHSGDLSGTVHGDQVSIEMGADGKAITLTGTTDGNSMSVQGPKGGSCSGSRH